MTDTERLDWLAEIALELPVELHVSQAGVFQLKLGRVESEGLSLRDALDIAIGPLAQPEP